MLVGKLQMPSAAGDVSKSPMVDTEGKAWEGDESPEEEKAELAKMSDDDLIAELTARGFKVEKEESEEQPEK